MIRKMQREDVAQVMRIWLNGNVDAHPFIWREYWESNYSTVQGQLAQAEVWVSEQHGDIQGFVGLMGDGIAGIFVDRRCRSQGVGKRLLDEVKARHRRLTLSVYHKNPRAKAFYLREGFSVLAEEMDEATGELAYTMLWKEDGCGEATPRC